MRIDKENLHLKFYTENKISPVRQDTGLSTLLGYRSELYRKLGLTNLCIRDANVLEVAPGAGQNSVYIASQAPRTYFLVEPNDTAVQQIEAVYSELNIPHTKPTVVNQRLEDFNYSGTPYDIVICENWLGSRSYERNLFSNLIRRTDLKGTMITTVISPIGILPNAIRRLISWRMTKGCDPSEAAGMLIDSFKTHLQTMSYMTRPHIDWVQDNMMNPGYLTICITLPDLVHIHDQDIQVRESYPRFAQDWRWFKSVNDDKQKNTHHLIGEYYKWCHGFIDHELEVSEGQPSTNKLFDNLCQNFFNSLQYIESESIDSDTRIATALEILEKINVLSAEIYSPEIVDQLSEGIRLANDSDITPEKVASCKSFCRLFGRETIYVSLSRVGPDA